MKRKLLIEITVDSNDSLNEIKNDLAAEISCCYHTFDVDNMKVEETKE